MNKMNDFFEIIPFFAGIDKNEIPKLLHCLNGRSQFYKKNDFIIHTDDEIQFMGIILAGSVRIIQEDINGNATILNCLEAPDFFAEVFVCAGLEKSPVTVAAAEDCEIYRISSKKILTLCSSRCLFHTRLIQNLLTITAKKTVELSKKIDIISKRTTREKILLFLEKERARQRSDTLTLPYNRQTLAEYLCVDRSALSRELSAMQKEGIIRFTKNRFELIAAQK